jgi:hypothetical protein
MSEVMNEQPSVAVKPRRNVLRSVMIWFVIALLTLPLIGVIAFANFYPEQWKAYTGRNAFPMKDTQGKWARMAWEEVEIIGGPVNSVPHNISAGLTRDGKTMVFARTLAGKGAKSNLYTCQRNEDGKTFSTPVLIKAVSTDKYNEIEPSITLDGKYLLFASNSPDGYGGYDIWASPKTDHGWGAAINLGPKVNSEFNERGPMMNPERDKLYISSDRPAESMSRRGREQFWRALKTGEIRRNYDIFVVDNMSLSKHANPLRDKKYRESLIVALGGTPETERAVERALDWMVRHQEPDGRWSMKKHGGGSSHDVGGTSMAILAFYGWGARHDEEGPYQDTLKKALGWLVAQGAKYKGNYSKSAGQGMYDHGMASIALAEAYSITKDKALLDPLKAALQTIVKAQHPQHGGWRYTSQPSSGDTSVYGWQMMALHCAEVAGVEIPKKTFERAKIWLDKVGGGEHKGLYGYTGPSPKDAMVAEGMFVQQLLGAGPSDPRQIESASYLVGDTNLRGKRKKKGNLPHAKSQTNMYYWYYGFLSLYQHQSPLWKKWNLTVRELLVDRQTKEGPDAGTWAPGQWKESGKLVATAMGALSLEVYYRYLPMYRIDGEATTVMVRTYDKDLNTVWKPKPKSTSVFLDIPLQARWLEALSSPSTEQSITFSYDGQYAYVASNREGGYGGYDLYRSLIVQGVIQTPENVGDPINGRDSETSPVITRDGYEMIFCSNRSVEGKSGLFLYRTDLTPISEVQKALTFLESIMWWLIGLLSGFLTLLGLLLWWLRAENRQQVSLLMRCLMGSAALHAIALILLSIIMLTVLVVEAGGDPMEISVDADSLASEKLALDIREQVTEIKFTPEPVRVHSNREPMLLPTIKPIQVADRKMVSSKFVVERTQLQVETKETPTQETETHANPDVKMIARVEFTIDAELETKPQPSEKIEKSEVAKPSTEFSVAEAAPAMTETADKAVEKPTDPAMTTPIQPVEVAFEATEAKVDATETVEQKDIPKPDVTAIGPMRFGTPDQKLEQRAEGAKQTRTGSAKVNNPLALAGGAPTMSNMIGKPVGGASAPARAAPRHSTGLGEMDIRPMYAESGPDNVGAPKLIGPGDLISRKSPRLEIAEVTDLAAPADRKSNYELRNPLNRNRVLKRLGGSDETERAIRLSLDWFTRTQEPEGHWDTKKHGGSAGHDNGSTGFAMLCYFGWGARHTEKGPYQVPMTKAVKWLISRVGEDGDLTAGDSQGMYDQGIATMALAEAYGMTKDPALLDPLRRAVGFIIRAQNKEGGWRYKYKSRDSDTSVVGWQVMALTSARMSGLRVPEDPFIKARKYLDSVSSGKNNGRYSYQGKKNPTPTMTAEGMFCQQIMGMRPSNPRMEDAISMIKINLPQAGKPNYYYWYYGCLSMFQHQGPVWDLWNKQMKKSLLEMQNKKGAHVGSWDPKGQWTSGKGGRVMSTAISTLSLEVYYRYLPMYSKPKIRAPLTPETKKPKE